MTPMGREGIYIPNSAEVSAAKEVAANLGQNLGTSISITNQSAGDQLLSELGKGAIQGGVAICLKKLREEKVHLKSGYALMLSQKKKQLIIHHLIFKRMNKVIVMFALMLGMTMSAFAHRKRTK